MSPDKPGMIIGMMAIRLDYPIQGDSISTLEPDYCRVNPDAYNLFFA